MRDQDPPFQTLVDKDQSICAFIIASVLYLSILIYSCFTSEKPVAGAYKNTFKSESEKDALLSRLHNECHLISVCLVVNVYSRFSLVAQRPISKLAGDFSFLCVTLAHANLCMHILVSLV